MILEINSTQTYAIRKPILRANQTLESCFLDNDNAKTTHHFGFFDNNVLVGVVSIFENSCIYFNDIAQHQVRAMAVLESHQKLNIGSLLLTHCCKFISQNGGNFIWLNSRITAVDFYLKNYFLATNHYFEIPEIGKHLLMFKRLVD